MPELKKAQQELAYLSHDELLQLLALQQEKARLDRISTKATSISLLLY
jgi:hypothetical protein